MTHLLSIDRVGTLIVGGGQAGLQTALSLRDFGYLDRVMIIGREPYLPYHRPPLSKAFLSSEKSVDSLLIRGPAVYERSSIEIQSDMTVTDIDAKNKVALLDNGTTIGFTSLVLAQGGQARAPEIPVRDASTGRTRTTDAPEGVVTLRSLEDAITLRRLLGDPKRVVLVGAGFVGLEVAASVTGLGHSATVIGRSNRLMREVLHPITSDYLREAHLRHGVTVELGVTIAALIERDNNVTGVELADGRVVPADLVIAGLGLIPETTLAEQLGLELDGGIVVDSEGRTGLAWVWATGDCANRRVPSGAVSRIESVHNAIDSARAVAGSIAQRPTAKRETPWFWSDQFAIKLQMAGSFGADTTTRLLGELSNDEFIVEHYQSGILVGVTAVNSPRQFLRYRQELDGPNPRKQ